LTKEKNVITNHETIFYSMNIQYMTMHSAN